MVIVFFLLMVLNGYLSAVNLTVALTYGLGFNLLIAVLNGVVAFWMYSSYKKALGAK